LKEENLKVSFFGGTFAEKIEGLQILAPPLKKKSEPPFGKNWRSIGGCRSQNGTYQVKQLSIKVANYLSSS